jgi:hypothetical protein
VGASEVVHANPAQLHALPPAVHAGVTDAFARSLHSVFLWAMPIGIAALIVTLFLREVPLRARQAEPLAAEALPPATVEGERAVHAPSGSRV